MSLAAYFTAQLEKRRAYAEYNKASAQLEVAQIRERAAELRSQYEPLAGLVDGAFKGPGCADPADIRAAINQAISYVINGRFPE